MKVGHGRVSGGTKGGVWWHMDGAQVSDATPRARWGHAGESQAHWELHSQHLLELEQEGKA